MLVPLGIQADLAEQGRRNVLIYTLLAGTGLRVNELRNISWADVDLEVGELTTRSWWKGNKNKKEETLPMAPYISEALKIWMEKHPGDPMDKIVEVPAGFVRTFNEDILAAGLAKKVKVGKKWVIQKRDGAGRTIDLHALRHKFFDFSVIRINELQPL